MTAKFIGKIHDTVTAIIASMSDVFLHVMEVCEST